MWNCKTDNWSEVDAYDALSTYWVLFDLCRQVIKGLGLGARDGEKWINLKDK